MIKQCKRFVHYFLYDMKMYNKFLLIYFVFVAVPFFSFAVFIGTTVADKMFSMRVSSARAVLEQAEVTMGNYLQKIVKETYDIYLDNETYAYLSRDYCEDDLRMMALLEGKLSTIVNNGELLNVSIYLADENKISKQHYRCQNMDAARNMAWYTTLTDSNKNTLWHFYGSTGYYVSSIFNKYDGKKLVGYIVITFSRSALMDILQEMKITDNTVAFITDEDDQLTLYTGGDFAHDRVAYIVSTKEKESREDYYVVKNVGDIGTYFVIDKELDSKQLTGMPKWKLSIAIPYGELMDIVRNVVYMVAVLLIVCLSFLGIVIAKIIGSITRRIDKLNRNMQRPQNQDFSVNDVPVGHDEISELRRNFNFMLSTVEQLLEERKIVDEHQRNLELNMLQAQINPHFLYNTLDMIRWAAVNGEAKEIPDLTSMLARFYKISLSDGARIVPLRDEIEHVKIYLDIQNKRFDSELVMSTEIDEKVRNCACIKLLLQPIVENAILHGIMEKECEKGEIRVKAVLENRDTVLITVTDNGIGMNQEVLSLLNGKKEYETSGRGYGLSNTNERIQLCYGPGYGLDFESRYGEYTTVYIRIRYVDYCESIRMNANLMDMQ